MEKFSEEQLYYALEAARDDLLAFIMFMNPDFVVAPHHRLISDKLMSVFKGDILRQMIFMPPRSSKSFMMNEYFPAWTLGRMPNWQYIVASHSSPLAEGFSREVRNMVNSPAYKMVFPLVELRADSRAANRWHTTEKGVYTAVGTGGAVAGRGANLALIDDPISEQDAWSKAERKKIIRWWPAGLRSRLMPNGRIIICQTRWHQNDLSGWLLEQERVNEDADKWDVLSIPALINDEEAKMLNEAREKLIGQGFIGEDYPVLEPGQTYWPVTPEYEHADFGLRGWHTSELEQTKKNMPDYQWQALYMQRPTAEEGNILKVSWWKDWNKYNPPQCEYVLVSMDTAFSTEEASSYSALITWGVFFDEDGQANLIMLGAQKGRWEYPTLRKKAFEIWSLHKPDIMLIEKKASGQSLLQDLKSSGIPVAEFLPDRDKVSRAHACTPVFNAGLIHAPTNKQWAQDVMHECAGFPSMEDTDYVDCVTQAIIWLRKGSWLRHPDDMHWQGEDDYSTIAPRKKRRSYY